MAEKKKSKLFAQPDKTTLSGMHIYKDKKGRNVYLNTFNKTGYIITDADEKGYHLYSMRFIIGVIAFVLLNGFILSPILAAVIGIGAYALLEMRFRTKFLPDLTQVPNFEPVAKESALNTASRDETKRIMIKCFLYLAFSILMAMNTYLQASNGEVTQFMEIVGYLVAIAGGGMFIFQVVALSRNMKNK